MDLRPAMTIAVTTVTIAAPLPSDRPRYLPDDAPWPVPGRTIYLFNDRDDDQTGLAACSDCITDTAKIDDYWTGKRRAARSYDCDVSFRPAQARLNHEYHCTISPCRQYGDRI